jgi:hypothetical protein
MTINVELISGAEISRNGDDLIWEEDGAHYRLQRADVKRLVLELNKLLDELKRYLREVY